jgi:membrane-associated phospholipid phosphatase
MRRLVLGFVVCVVPAAGARPQDATHPGLEYKASLDVPLTVASVVGTVAPPLLTDASKTWTCRWCDRHPDGSDALNGLDAEIRRDWRWSDRERAHRWSNVALGLSFAAPAGAFVAARGGFANGFGEEMLLVLESGALSMAATQATKYLFRRERPWAHAEDPSGGERLGSRDSVLSFASGHASLAFAFAVSTGSLASLRGDDGKEWVWATGLTFAAATSYLRIAADRHYLTDVLAGAAIGTTLGWVVPRLIDRHPEPAATAGVARSRETRVALFRLVVGAGPGGGWPGRAVMLTGGIQGGGPFVSATWGF